MEIAAIVSISVCAGFGLGIVFYKAVVSEANSIKQHVTEELQKAANGIVVAAARIANEAKKL